MVPPPTVANAMRKEKGLVSPCTLESDGVIVQTFQGPIPTASESCCAVLSTSRTTNAVWWRAAGNVLVIRLSSFIAGHARCATRPGPNSQRRRAYCVQALPAHRGAVDVAHRERGGVRLRFPFVGEPSVLRHRRNTLTGITSASRCRRCRTGTPRRSGNRACAFPCFSWTSETPLCDPAPCRPSE